uniref:uncharacterized protein LOC122588807 n=1 Tax=Erigeron canadensis TaxID=72917 RepID=UPI001CB9BC9F|nr:uncharacterized protein LOC122588807 [Erigeron canadensis]
MSDKLNTHQKGIMTEEDVSTILQRYTATTVLALLQEVAQVHDAKLDWKALVKRTATGIKSPREYQMLWRHLAYRHDLAEKLETEAKPLDDDSDLEYELEAFPPINNEASSEAAACVKVLIASGSTSHSGLEKGLTIEAPLTINIPGSKSTGNSSENPLSVRGTNITVPVSVQRQPHPVVATSTEELDKNGPVFSSFPPRKKRKPWSAAEDMELFAAVEKCGEGNWATILKGGFKSDRTASQLSQRWAIIKKRNANANVKPGTQLSEVQLAARRALNMALDPPGGDSLKTSSTLGRTKSSITNITPMRSIFPDSPSTSTLFHDQPCEDTSAQKKTFHKIRPKTSPKSLTNGPDPIKAAAVAAGARIATQTPAADMLKQRMKSAIHIKTNATNFRNLPSPLALRPQDHNAIVGPPVQFIPVSAAQETNGVTSSSSANSSKVVQEDQATTITAKVETLQDTSEKEVKEDAASSIVEPMIMETCD